MKMLTGVSRMAKLTNKPFRYFAHLSAESLGREIDTLSSGQRPLVVTDGAFATSDDLPPLDQYADLLKHVDGTLLVDESHSGGVVGETGRGSAQHFGVEDIAHVGVTLSKAFCGRGMSDQEHRLNALLPPSLSGGQIRVRRYLRTCGCIEIRSE